MYRYYKGKNGYPEGLYRTPEQIKRDMRIIGDRISETMYMLNVRNIIAEIISDGCGEDLERRAGAVRELVEEAEEALSNLKELEETLDELRAELEDSLMLIGGV